MKTVICSIAWTIIGLVSVLIGSIKHTSNYEVAEMWGKAYKRFVLDVMQKFQRL